MPKISTKPRRVTWSRFPRFLPFRLPSFLPPKPLWTPFKTVAKVAVPDDAANTARAYVLLQKAGWITLNPDVDLSTVTQADITENPYNIEFTEMNSTNIPAVLDDFDYAVITGSIVYNAGIDPSTALLQEDILPHLILQVVVKEENKDAQWAKDIVAAYHSDEFKEYLDKNNNGLWFVPEELFN